MNEKKGISLDPQRRKPSWGRRTMKKMKNQDYDRSTPADVTVDSN